jgi:hypothetical protein
MLVFCARSLRLWPFWIGAGFSTQLPCRYVRKIVDFLNSQVSCNIKKKVHNKWEGRLLSDEMIGVLSWGTYWNVQETVVSQITKKFPTYSFSNNQEISYILSNSEGSLLYSQKRNICPCFEPEEFSSHTPILCLLLHLYPFVLDVICVDGNFFLLIWSLYFRFTHV